MRIQFFCSVAALLVPMVLTGCGGAAGPELGTVTGKVTIDGQPVQKALITFTPQNGPPSYGGTNPEGQYSMMFTADKNGAVIGKHSVTIEAGTPKSDEDGKLLPDQKITPVPKKYARPGELTADVKAGPNVFDFALESR